ncbi:hypothetical protein B0H19DRAFT_1056792 [Mycena capillaripes]|nr:hypothetical protein B0H19DRAFT_1056792 [Mycena capillaripes]
MIALDLIYAHLPPIRTPAWGASVSSGWRTMAAYPYPNLIPMTLPDVKPSEYTIQKFWMRVAEVTTRYHDEQRKWRGGEDVVRWNLTNTRACDRCENSENKRVCEIDPEHPSCRPCRVNKVKCNRKLLFVFEMTKDQLFPVYTQFLKGLHDRKPGQLRRIRNHAQRFNSGRLDEDDDGASETASKIISPEMIARVEELQNAVEMVNGNIHMLSEQFEAQNRQMRRVQREALHTLERAKGHLYRIIVANNTGKRVGGREEVQALSNALYILDDLTRRLGSSPSLPYNSNTIGLH